jgi:RNA polymerase sigma-70 factor, ECF subfamily
VAAGARRLDPQSRAWLEQLRSEGWVREAAIARLHALLLREARQEVRRRTATLAHPSGPDLEDLALQAADDALVAILRKLNQFRGDALFTTWACRFAQLEVPGEIRRRLGHSRETPTDVEAWPPEGVGRGDPQQLSENRERARGLGYLIAHELTDRQREVVLAMAVNEIPAKQLSVRLNSTPGALYKTLHDARRKLRGLLAEQQAENPDRAPRRAGHPDTCITSKVSAAARSDR